MLLTPLCSALDMQDAGAESERASCKSAGPGKYTVNHGCCNRPASGGQRTAVVPAVVAPGCQVADHADGRDGGVDSRQGHRGRVDLVRLRCWLHVMRRLLVAMFLTWHAGYTLDTRTAGVACQACAVQVTHRSDTKKALLGACAQRLSRRAWQVLQACGPCIPRRKQGTSMQRGGGHLPRQTRPPRPRRPLVWKGSIPRAWATCTACILGAAKSTMLTHMLLSILTWQAGSLAGCAAWCEEAHGGLVGMRRSRLVVRGRFCSRAACMGSRIAVRDRQPWHTGRQTRRSP